MSHRFFVSPKAIAGGMVILNREIAHQLRNVLRLQPGSEIVVLDDSGREYDVTLTRLSRDGAAGQISGQRLCPNEPRISLTLYACLIKGERFEWVLQKGTELGVSRFVPVISERTVLRDPARVEKRRPRWARIVREAAEQSRRARLPVLERAMSFPDACAESVDRHDRVLLPWEETTEGSLGDAVRDGPTAVERIALIVGPEGGFTLQEVAQAQERGIQVVTLGPRILRAETAGIVAAALVMGALGELG